MKCEDCVYYWFNEDYRRMMCNYDDNTGFGVAPCEENYYDDDEPGMEYYAEEEDYEPDDNYLEMGFNPYEGCYDYDC